MIALHQFWSGFVQRTEHVSAFAQALFIFTEESGTHASESILPATPRQDRGPLVTHRL